MTARKVDTRQAEFWDASSLQPDWLNASNLSEQVRSSKDGVDLGHGGQRCIGSKYYTLEADDLRTFHGLTVNGKVVTPAYKEIGGTNGNDFFHQKDDGLTPPDGYNDIAELNSGKNIITPGNGTDSVHGGTGSTIIFVNDALEISGLAEYLDGGGGYDQLIISDSGNIDLSQATLVSIEGLQLGATGVLLNPEQLSDLNLDLPSYKRGIPLTLAHSGSVTLSGYISGALALYGSEGDDSITLTSDTGSTSDVNEAKLISGKRGDDTILFDPSESLKMKAELRGGDGDDMIVNHAAGVHMAGADGADRLTGSDTDRDDMSGGSGADRFIFTSTAGSSVSHPDLIRDFSHADGDRIDLSAIDGDTATAGQQGFHFVDAFSGHAGELVQSLADSKTLLQGDVNGDGHADFAILLKGAPTLVDADVRDADDPALPLAHAAFAALHAGAGLAIV